MRTPHVTRTSAFALVLTFTMGLSACTQTQDEPTKLSPNELSFGQVHGLATIPADDRLYVASDDGLFGIDDGVTRGSVP